MPLFWVSLAFILGIRLGYFLEWQLAAWVVLAVVTLILTLLSPLRGRVYQGLPETLQKALDYVPVPVVALLLFCSLGAVRLLVAMPDLAAADFIATHTGTDLEVVVRGVLVEPPDERDTYTNLRVEAERIRYEGEASSLPVRGLLLARAQPGGARHAANPTGERGIFVP